MKNPLWKYFILSAVLFSKEGNYINPIIPGAHPDPSICRVGDDYYIVNSSFEFFPGLPIHHSKDLVNWELVGHGLHREDQCNGEMNLVDVQSDGGIHAPTIRYNKGTFYIITTNVYNRGDGTPGKMVNFIITAKKASGPWSKPHIIEGAPGIDPDIFFDDNGKVYFTGTHAPGDMNQNGIGEIWIQELNLKDWKLLGKRHTVWDGAFGCCTEGPHIYKGNGLYYLMVAEGGTGKNHAVMIAASKQIFGPYEENPRNPILTSRHLTDQYFVNSTGHADLIQLPDGRWYMVALGKRNDLNGDSNMGRETYLMPVSWEPAIVKWEQVSKTKWEPVKYLWPVVSPQSGKVERYAPLPFPEKKQYRNDEFIDDFDIKGLNLEWNFVRVPKNGTYSISENPGYFRLYAKPDWIKNRKQFSLVGFRQKESDFEYEVKMKFSPSDDKVECGIIHYQKEYNYLASTVYKDNRKFFLSLRLAEKHKDPIPLKKIRLNNYRDEIIFKVISNDDKYNFFYSLDNGNSFESYSVTKAEVVLDRNYTGAYLGMYATSNGKESSDFADYEWVRYKGFSR